MAITSTATKESITNQPGSINFLCPGCTKVEIVRTVHDRKTATPYTCPSCGFRGPVE